MKWDGNKTAIVVAWTAVVVIGLAAMWFVRGVKQKEAQAENTLSVIRYALEGGDVNGEKAEEGR